MTKFRRVATFSFLLAVVPTALLLGVLQVADPGANESLADDVERIESPDVPTSHRVHLKALRKFRNLAYKRLSAEACIADLSRTLGMKIRLHESILKRIRKPSSVIISTTEPVSHQTAIRLVMRSFSLYRYGIVFQDGQITLITGPEYRGPSLQTYDLQSRSDFSLAERRRQINSTLRAVHPGAWGASSNTWIRPGESVYEIDVYQSQDVHDLIRKRLYDHHAVVTTDKDVLSLSFLGEIERKKTGEKLDKEAVVKRLRKKYAYESMADRLKHESTRQPAGDIELSPAARERIRKTDEQFEKTRKSKYAYTMMRSKSLQLLHEGEVEAFVGRPGAGLMRMTPPGPSYLPGNPPRDLPLASNEMMRSSFDRPVTLPETKALASGRRVFLPSRQALQAFHQNGESAFLTPQSFGFVKNRDNVAGFQSHGFAFAPRLVSHIARPWYRKEKELWAIHRLELVSLQLHDTPVVYESRSMPRMDELKKATTRELNGFEQSALRKLRNGEDVVAKASLNRIEMIGSLRATKQCRQCHDVKGGALLGAFSYELLRDPQLDPAKLREIGGINPIP